MPCRNERFILRNGTRKGVMTLTAGTLDTQACTQTWSTTSDVMTISGTGVLTEIGCINTLPLVQSGASSVVYVENSTWNTARNSYLISSTAGQISIANSVIINTTATTGGGVSIANAATAAAPNVLSGMLVAAALSVSITTGVTVYSKVSVSGAKTLTTAIGVADLIGAGTTAQGQISTPTLSQGTALSLAATTAPNIKATTAFTLTIPATSATYAGLTWQVSAAGYVVTYSGTFKYITATRNSWTSFPIRR